MSGVGVNGVERSVLNKLFRGYHLAVDPDGRFRYYDEHDEPEWTESRRVVDRLRWKGLITNDGRLSERGRSLISAAQRYR